MNIVKKTLIKVMAKSSGPMIKNLFVTVGNYSQAFYKCSGQASLPNIADAAAEAGARMAANTAKMMSVKCLKDAGEAFLAMDMMIHMGIEVLPSPENTLHMTVAKCPYGNEGAGRHLCEAMMTTDKKMISSLLGKEVDMQIPQSTAAGDKQCDVIFTLK